MKFSKYSNVYLIRIPQRHRGMDGRTSTDRQLAVAIPCGKMIVLSEYLHLQHKICTKSHDVAFKIIKISRCNSPGLQRRGEGKGRLTCSARTGFRAVTTPLYNTATLTTGEGRCPWGTCSTYPTFFELHSFPVLRYSRTLFYV